MFKIINRILKLPICQIANFTNCHKSNGHIFRFDLPYIRFFLVIHKTYFDKYSCTTDTIDIEGCTIDTMVIDSCCTIGTIDIEGYTIDTMDINSCCTIDAMDVDSCCTSK